MSVGLAPCPWGQVTSRTCVPRAPSSESCGRAVGSCSGSRAVSDFVWTVEISVWSLLLQKRAEQMAGEASEGVCVQ